MRASLRRLGLGLGAALLLGIAGAWWARGIRLVDYQRYSPVFSTRTKGILRAHSIDGLHFTVETVPLLSLKATSQTHYRDEAGLLWVIGTDPTDLIGRDASGKVGEPKRSTLFKLNVQTGERSLLEIEPCLNTAESDRAPVQCVDPAVLTLPDGRMIMSFVRMPGRGDPALSENENQFLSAISTADGGWVAEPGLRLYSAHAADPDLLRLPDGRWRLYYTSGSVSSPWGGGASPGIRSAISLDGKTFSLEAGVRVFGCSASSTLRLQGGVYRLYCHTRDVFQGLEPDADDRAHIVSYLSQDGLEFTKEHGIRLGVEPVTGGRFIGSEAPSITVEPDGSLTMLLTTVVERAYPENQWLLDRELAHMRRMSSAAKRRDRKRKRR